jgi:hypothetical protein
MSQFLRKLHEDAHLYIPYSMKKQFPTAVAKAILQQNQLIKDTWVIVVIGTSRDLMLLIEKNIHALAGVVGISDTNCTDKTGGMSLFKKMRARPFANAYPLIWPHFLTASSSPQFESYQGL